MFDSSRWLTRIEAAEYLRVSVPTIDRWARSGAVHKFSVPGVRAVRFDREQLDTVFTRDVSDDG